MGDISKNFSIAEFKSPDMPCVPPWAEMFIRRLVIEALQPIRDYAGPIIINSGHRSGAHNIKVNGASQSYHLIGAAADFKLKESEPTLEDIFLAERDWEGGLRLYDGWLHLDGRHWFGVGGHRWRHDK